MNAEWAEPPKDQGRSSLATPGAQLAAQREAMGMSVEQIADQLKLAPRQVAALEAGDYAALPNMAVVRGFVRAYAKVVKLDPTPLVAMIAVVSPTSHEAAPPRKEVAPTFTESRFPLMTDRSSAKSGKLVAAAVLVVAVVGAGVYAYRTGLISPTWFERSAGEHAASATVELPKPADSMAPIETKVIPAGQEQAPLQSPNVPLISVPPPASANTANTVAGTVTGTVTSAATGTVAGAAANTAANPAANGGNDVAAVAPAGAVSAAAGAGSQLVLEVTEDSWVEIRRPGAKPLIARLVKAGSTESFDIRDPALLIIGKPGAVKATLGGAPLALPPIAGGTISRVNIK